MSGRHYIAYSVGDVICKKVSRLPAEGNADLKEEKRAKVKLIGGGRALFGRAGQERI